jgi:SAM-dependent methyltransferase
VDLSRRATDPELLDTGVPEAEAVRSLDDLRFVNRWLGGRRSLMRAAEPFLAGARTLLDVGCGSADLTALLWAACPPGTLAVGLDCKIVHLRHAPPGVERVVADVCRLPFPERSFDIVTANLFLHHFDGDEAALLLRRLYGLARRALIVNDLRRSRVAYLFGCTFFPILFRSPVSVNDGLLSIRRAFTQDELRAAFRDAGVSTTSLYRAFPYRLVAVAERR